MKERNTRTKRGSESERVRKISTDRESEKDKGWGREC